MIKKEKVNSVIPASHVGGCCELSAVVTEALNGNPAQPQVQFQSVLSLQTSCLFSCSNVRLSPDFFKTCHTLSSFFGILWERFIEKHMSCYNACNAGVANFQYSQGNATRFCGLWDLIHIPLKKKKKKVQERISLEGSFKDFTSSFSKI